MDYTFSGRSPQENRCSALTGEHAAQFKGRSGKEKLPHGSFLHLFDQAKTREQDKEDEHWGYVFKHKKEEFGYLFVL
jgi:hypothetical protein